ncbi:Sarcolemmal membrane-associated protein [Plecturocebus cupreus]
MSRKELENQVGSLKEQHLRDSADLKTFLSKAENQAKDVQKEYEKTQTILSERKLKFDKTEQEKQSITDELKQCENNLKLLREKGKKETLALDAHVGCPGCSNSHRAVCARSGKSFSMRAFLESIHHPPSGS